jgi:alpha-tubulin suppressor-like RCC1 family protein
MPRISALPQAITAALADQFPLVQGAVTKRVSFQTAQDSGLFLPADNSITTAKLQDKAVTSDKLQSDPTINTNRAVSSNHIQDAAVSTTKLNTDAVSTIKIQDEAVTFGKLGAGSLALSKFNDVDRVYLQNAATARPGASVITSGFVKNIVVYNAGSNYSNPPSTPPTVTIDPPPTGGRTATATAIVAGGLVSSIVITDEGFGYKTTPSVTISAPTGGGTTARAYAFTVINGLCSSDPRSSSIGTQHGSFVITTDRKLKSWGYNGYGQLGHSQDNGVTSSPREVLPYTLSNTPSMPVKVYACGSTAFYIDEFGSVWSAGYNGYGQTGLTAQSFVFQQISPAYFSNKPVIKLATTAGAYTDAQSILALTADGYVYGWGYNGYGQLGLPASTSVSTPTLVPGTGTTYVIKDIVSIGAVSGSSTICAFLQADGRVLCSGYNVHGALSDGTINTRSGLDYWKTSLGNPITNVIQMHGNGDYPHLALLTGTGEVWTSGYNGYNQLGNGTTTSTGAGYGTRVIATGATAIYGNAGHYGNHIVTMNDGTIRAWGYNGYGQVGNGTVTNVNTPTNTFTEYFGRSVVKATCSQWNYTTSAILLSDGSIYCCGYDGYSKQGRMDGQSLSHRNSWAKFRLPRGDVIDIRWQSYADYSNLEVLTSDGKVYSVGYNGWGSMCQGDTTNKYGISNYLL